MHAKCYLYCSAAAAAVADKRRPVVHNATTLAGQPVVVNCQLPVTGVQQHVVWLRPPDGLPLPLPVHNSHAAADAAGNDAALE